MPVNKDVVTETRIVIAIDDSWIFEKDPAKRQAAIDRHGADIISSIRRHVDDVGHMNIEHEYENQCEYCDDAWTEEGDTFNGGCCEKDMDNEPSEELKK